MLDTVLGAGDTAVKKTVKVPELLSLNLSGRDGQ